MYFPLTYDQAALGLLGAGFLILWMMASDQTQRS